MVRLQNQAEEPPRKRFKISKPDEQFSSVHEIRAIFRLQNGDELKKALTSLRNQLAVKADDLGISVQDDRLLLSQRWMESEPGAQSLFDLWERATQDQTGLVAVILAILSSLLSLLSSHYSHHQFGQPILKTLLSSQWICRLNSYVRGTHSDLTLAALKLLNSMSAFGSESKRSKLQESFPWEYKSLSKLLQMRHKSKNKQSTSDFRHPDIRTSFISFVLSFIGDDNTTLFKTTFLERHRDIFLSIFKGLIRDSYPVLLKVLETSWRGILSDHKLKKTLKVVLFNESTIAQVVRLYERAVPENNETDHVPADAAHHFLLALCTHPGAGICFKDRGWYPLDSDGEERLAGDEDEPQIARRGRIYNKILANVLKTMKVNEDPRQQELALKIMEACPELPAGYWNRASPTLEPRLSSKWIANISFLGSVVSLPVPAQSFILPQSTLYQPSPPPLSTIIENILPSVNSRVYISKGLQSTSPLVQHCSAITLAKCLLKYADVVQIFRIIKSALDENEGDGQWSRRLTEIERELRKRVPDFQVIVAFAQQATSERLPAIGRQPNSLRSTMIAESAQRLLWLYHRCLPLLVAEARFDVGKLLNNFLSASQTGDVDAGDAEKPDCNMPLRTVSQLHVLRLLTESDQFVWSAKPSASSPTYFHTLLKASNTTPKPAIRVALTNLLCQVLSESILFEEDANEPILWLAALPVSRRASDAEAPDGAQLTDEGTCVIRFLDDCVQRCLKTPYRYIEQLRDLAKITIGQDSLQEHLETLPSPVLATVLEQLKVQVSNRLLSPSDVLALASFVRKLLLKLAAKQWSFKLLQAVANEFDASLGPSGLFSEYPIVSAAVRREVSVIRYCLGVDQDIPVSNSVGVGDEVRDFLNQIEKLAFPKTMAARIVSAFELVDWLRLVDVPLSSEDICRVAAVIEQRHKPALKEFFLSLHPAHGQLWEIVGLGPVSRILADHVEFDWILAHTRNFDSASRKKLLVDIFYTHPVSRMEIKMALCLVIHRLLLSKDDDDVCRNFFLLLGEILRRTRKFLDSVESTGIREFVFLQSPLMSGFGISTMYSEVTFEGLTDFIETSLDASCSSDRKLISDITNHYFNVLKTCLTTGDNSQTRYIKLWAKYFEPPVLSDLLAFIGDNLGYNITNAVTLELLPCILKSLQRSASAVTQSSEIAKLFQLQRLVRLLPLLGNDAILEEMIAAAITAHIPAGLNIGLLPRMAPPRLALQITGAQAQWPCCDKKLLDDLRIATFLKKRHWTVNTVRIVSVLLYRQSSARTTFLRWLASDDSTHLDIGYFTSVMYTFLDSSTPDFMRDHARAVSPHITRVIAAALDSGQATDVRSLSTSCLIAIVSLFPSERRTICSSVESHFLALPANCLHPQMLVLGYSFQAAAYSEAHKFINMLVEYGLNWFIRCCSGGDQFTEDEEACIAGLAQLLKSSRLTSSSTETAFIAVIKYRLDKQACIDLLDSLLLAAPLKPLIVNRQLQSILQHPRFFQLSKSDSPVRDSIISLLHALFHTHPTNTCQPTHVDPLVHVYTGTCSTSDLQLLSIFRLFEPQRGSSLATLFSQWASSPDLPSTTVLGTINSLDSSRVLRTCLAFPHWRRLGDLTQAKDKHADGQVYDPVFLVPLLAHALLEAPPSSSSGWVELFRTNIVSLLIRCMSSRDHDMRDLALTVIVALWKALNTVNIQEGPHVMYILGLLKNALPEPSEGTPPSLPTPSTLILLHSLRGIFYPSHFVYPSTARFLLQRPELDTGDVPMLYGMLYSSSDDWKRERMWIVRFLADGMVDSDDWKVLRRRHTWALLSSFFQSSEDDSLRSAILEVLASLTCHVQPTTSLVLKSSLLSWIEMQLVTLRSGESLAWLRILHNIIAVVDPAKLEVATSGQWRSAISRCCSLLIKGCIQSPTLPTFVLAAQMILRISSLLPGSSTTPQISSLLILAVSCIRRLEEDLEYPQGAIVRRCHQDDGPPYRSYSLHRAPTYEHPLEAWGVSVEALWRVAMRQDEKHATWDGLTCRLLLWRCMVGEEGSPIGEWARREVVRNLVI